jgi:hypothetical protein
MQGARAEQARAFGIGAGLDQHAREALGAERRGRDQRRFATRASLDRGAVFDQHRGDLAVTAVRKPALADGVRHEMQRVGFVPAIEIPADRGVRARGLGTECGAQPVDVACFDELAEIVVGHAAL